MEPKYFSELARRLNEQQIRTGPRHDNSLPVVFAGQEILLITQTGTMMRAESGEECESAKKLFPKVQQTASLVHEYITAMEQAAPLKAEGLDTSYRQLAEFNDTVLAGQTAEGGIHFAVLDWNAEHTALCHIGRNHIITIHGNGMPSEEYQQIDGKAEALKLLRSGNGNVTPYGVVFDNEMKLQPLYDGRHFPPYLYEPCQLTIEIRLADGSTGASDYLYFPTPDQQLARTLERAGATDAADSRMQITVDQLPKEVSTQINLQQEALVEVNEMCASIAKLSPQECRKLNAAVAMAQPRCASEIRQLAENLEQFEFVPDVKTPEEYGKYMIQQSGRFEYDPNLEDFYDFQGYGQQKVSAENGQFNDYGYISYHGVLTLGELMLQDPAEQAQDESGPHLVGVL